MTFLGFLDVIFKTHRRSFIWLTTEAVLVAGYWASKTGNYSDLCMWSVTLGCAFGAAHTVEAVKGKAPAPPAK